MYTPVDLVVDLVIGLLEMIRIIGTEVTAANPLSAVAVAGGAAFITLAVVVFGYSALGAILAEIGITLPRFGVGPQTRE